MRLYQKDVAPSIAFYTHTAVILSSYNQTNLWDFLSPFLAALLPFSLATRITFLILPLTHKKHEYLCIGFIKSMHFSAETKYKLSLIKFSRFRPASSVPGGYTGIRKNRFGLFLLLCFKEQCPVYT